MSHRRAFERTRAVQMTQHCQFDVVESPIGAKPARAVVRLALVAFGRAGRRERGFRGEMRLAEKGRVVACAPDSVLPINRLQHP